MSCQPNKFERQFSHGNNERKEMYTRKRNLAIYLTIKYDSVCSDEYIDDQKFTIERLVNYCGVIKSTNTKM